MKTILFCIHNFAIGGVPRALLSLLPHLEKADYDVTIFCPNQKGAFQSEFAGYKVLPQDKMLELFSMNLSNSPFTLKKLCAIILKGIRRILIRFQVDIYLNRLFSTGRSFSNKFDIVVAYSEGDITEMVSRIQANKKIAWVHIDYKRLQVYNHQKDESEIYSRFDKIVSPSSFSARSFKDVYPQLTEKVISIPNLLDVDYIRKNALSEEPLDARFDSSTFTIVSVGRICGEKQFYHIPKIASRVNAQFKWFIIGSGSIPEETELMNQISEYAMEDRVIFMRAKSNPYPYISQSNLLVSLSLSETFSYSIYEAKLLGVPVVSTAFGSSDEVMNDDAGVLISDDNVSTFIEQIINDENSYNSMRNAAQSFRYVPDAQQYVDLFSL